MFIRLGIDASQPVASCAVSCDEKIIAADETEKPIENFPALIRNVISNAGIRLNDVDEIVVCIGPGSQTGIRTAVVIGNALALALRKPISGILSTDAAAMIAGSKGTYKVATSAGRRRWYVGEYHWKDNVLCRVNEVLLMDELTADILIMFNSNSESSRDSELCACGILKVAEYQRQLVEQSLLSKILLYERLNHDGI